MPKPERKKIRNKTSFCNKYDGIIFDETAKRNLYRKFDEEIFGQIIVGVNISSIVNKYPLERSGKIITNESNKKIKKGIKDLYNFIFFSR